MKRYILPILTASFITACGDSAGNGSDKTKNDSHDSTAVEVDSSAIVEEIIEEVVIPDDIYELDTLTVNEDWITDYSGEGIFYAYEDSVAFKDFASGQTHYIGADQLNGSQVEIEKAYKISSSDYYSDCCDPWSEEEFCNYYLLVETANLHGYIKGDNLFKLPTIDTSKVDLYDEKNDISYSFYTADGFRGCYNGIVLMNDGSNQLSPLKLLEPEYERNALGFYGEWVGVTEYFMRGDKPVILLNLGVDGNYSYYFYEIYKKGGEYVADNYFYSDIAVTMDEFDSGFDFDSALHEHYRQEFDGEDFESNW